MKTLAKPNREKIKRIDEWVKENSSYGYYCEPSALKRLKPTYRPGVNCSDIDTVEEQIEEHRKEYFKKHVLRKATPEELEWIHKQPKVDLDAPENEHLKKALIKLAEEGWFDIE